MNLASISAELESDLAWRQNEIRGLQNLLFGIEKEEERERFRRPLILVLYAHFEGFCKFAMHVYVRAINDTGIVCDEADFAIAAASLADLFRALRDSQRKCDEFRRELPDDTKLHRFARDREFIERASDFWSRRVTIPDSIIDTESNLSPVVLRKNLFRLGLDHTHFIDKERHIRRLLNIRNEIGHGSMKDGVQAKVYDDLRQDAFGVMESLSSEIATALRERQYLRKRRGQDHAQNAVT